MKKIFLFISFLVGISECLHAQNSEAVDYILVLNSINFNEVKTRMFFENIRDEFSSDEVKVVSESLGLKLTVKEESLAVPSLQSMEEIHSKQHYLRQKYGSARKPLALLFIGDPGWLLCKPLFDDMWKDVPTIICMARDRMVPDIYKMLDKDEALLKSELKPTEEVLKPYNAVALTQPVFIHETIGLMRQLIPEMKKVAFVSDQRYISLFTRIELKDTLKCYFPELELQELTSPQLNTQDLLDTLSLNTSNTGLIYFSWFVPMRKSIDTYLDDNIQTIVSAFSKAPVFTLADLNPENGNFAGGHYIDAKSLSETCIEVLYRILNGERPHDMSVMRGGVPKTILNYTHLSHYNIPLDYFPSDACYVQAPPTFWEKNKWILVAVAAMLLLVVAVICMRMHGLAARQRTRNREIQMLKDYKHFLEDIFNNLSVAVAVRDIQDGLRFLYWNKEAENIFGLSQEELMEDMERALSSNEIVRELNQNDKDILKGSGRFSGLCKFEDKEGNPVFLYVNKRTVSHSNGKKWLLITCWDMTEQQVNTEKLADLNKRMQTVLDVAEMNIWTYDIQKDVLLYDGISSLPGVLPTGNKCNLEAFISLVSSGERTHIKEEIIKFLQGEIPSFHEEFTIDRSFSGILERPVWLRSYATVLKYDETGKPEVLMGANKDVSEQKKLETALIQAKLAAEEANKLKDVFLANMSHEIRTPLNSIVGFSSILGETEDADERAEYSKIIQNNTELLLQLINDILDLSKIEAGSMEFVYKNVDVYALFAELEKTTRWRVQESGVEILFDESQAGLMLYIDANRFMQVMNNFMTNAIKFTHQGSIRFGYKACEEGGWYFYLTDTGEGIPAEKVNTVFDRFVKLDSFKQGTGLGLSICNSIVERFGGEIGVTSEWGAGSTFWFTLPESRAGKECKNSEEK